MNCSQDQDAEAEIGDLRWRGGSCRSDVRTPGGSLFGGRPVLADPTNLDNFIVVPRSSPISASAFNCDTLTPPYVYIYIYILADTIRYGLKLNYICEWEHISQHIQSTIIVRWPWRDKQNHNYGKLCEIEATVSGRNRKLGVRSGVNEYGEGIFEL
ncbi:hypothetical protein QE152_g24892 [Popillia japonica]|uniref:Uncharacterized protein n=1 Tax=Popillia japonica TaxID=7064 RepID=A0AAW1K3G4_POPJA